MELSCLSRNNIINLNTRSASLHEVYARVFLPTSFFFLRLLVIWPITSTIPNFFFFFCWKVMHWYEEDVNKILCLSREFWDVEWLGDFTLSGQWARLCDMKLFSLGIYKAFQVSKRERMAWASLIVDSTGWGKVAEVAQMSSTTFQHGSYRTRNTWSNISHHCIWFLPTCGSL